MNKITHEEDVVKERIDTPNSNFEFINRQINKIGATSNEMQTEMNLLLSQM